MPYTASLDLAMETASYFDLDFVQARKIIREVGSATSLWRSEALRVRIKKTEIDRMATAFEHEDFQKTSTQGR